MDIRNVTREQVESVYSGRQGCACGCRGKYFYASDFRVESGKRRGYSVHPDEVSDRMIAKVLNLLKKNASDVVFDDKYRTIFWWDKPGVDRTYTVYLKEELK